MLLSCLFFRFKIRSQSFFFPFVFTQNVEVIYAVTYFEADYISLPAMATCNVHEFVSGEKYKK